LITPKPHPNHSENFYTTKNFNLSKLSLYWATTTLNFPYRPFLVFISDISYLWYSRVYTSYHTNILSGFGFSIQKAFYYVAGKNNAFSCELPSAYP